MNKTAIFFLLLAFCIAYVSTTPLRDDSALIKNDQLFLSDGGDTYDDDSNKATENNDWLHFHFGDKKVNIYFFTC